VRFRPPWPGGAPQARVAAASRVAEFQARGLVHFHAIIRLDGAEDRATAPGVAVSPEELCDAIREAAGRARLDGDADISPQLLRSRCELPTALAGATAWHANLREGHALRCPSAFVSPCLAELAGVL